MPIQTLSTIAPSSESSSHREHCFLESDIEVLTMAELEKQALDDSFSKMSIHDESTVSITEDANDLQNTV